MPYPCMSAVDKNALFALRQQLYEQPRWLYVTWNDARSSSSRHWALFVSHAEDTAYGMFYQIVSNPTRNAHDTYRLEVTPGQITTAAGSYKIGRIPLRVESALAANSYGGLLLDEVNERNRSAPGKVCSQDWTLWVLECFERNQLLESGSAERVRARVPK